jgi:hypothetical protein
VECKAEQPQLFARVCMLWLVSAGGTYRACVCCVECKANSALRQETAAKKTAAGDAKATGDHQFLKK